MCFIKQPKIINVYHNEYSQEFHYYPFSIRYLLSIEVCILNKRENLKLGAFIMIAGINESKTLKKHVLCEWKCRLDGKTVVTFGAP